MVFVSISTNIKTALGIFVAIILFTSLVFTAGTILSTLIEKNEHSLKYHLFLQEEINISDLRGNVPSKERPWGHDAFGEFDACLVFKQWKLDNSTGKLKVTKEIYKHCVYDI